MVNGGRVRAVVTRARAPICFLFLVCGGSLLLRNDFTASTQPIPAAARTTNVDSAFGRLPLAFEPNRGQTDSRVKFLAHGGGYGIFLTPSEAVLSLAGDTGRSFLSMRLAGAQPDAEVAAMDQLPGRSNYIIGNDRSRWHINIPQFSRVRYRGVYPGIDLDFYGKQGRLEYDFDVNPGADFREIELDFGGAQDLNVAPNGDLVMSLNGREMRFHAPRIYQKSSSGDQDVTGNFFLRGLDRVAFEVGEYDRSRTLVIDPVLSFSTYLGGAGDESCGKIAGQPFVAHCPSVVVDSAQRVYVAGATTSSTAFPGAASGAAVSGASDVFVTRINSSGTAVDFTSFVGGNGMDYPVGIAIDSGFNVYLAGTTTSTNFPVTATAFQPSVTGGQHVFVTKLDPTASTTLYSTYLAGSGTDSASALAVDSQGLEYVFGTTTATNFAASDCGGLCFPTTATALQPHPAAANQFFFSKINPSETVSASQTLDYSTFIGGGTPTTGTVTGGGIAVDSNSPPNVYLAGGTTFTDMPLLNAFQGTFPSKSSGPNSVWVAKLTPPTNSNIQQYTPLFETYFGGSGNDIAYGVATDGTDTLVTGSTTSPNITIPSGVAAFQSAPGGGTDAFIARFSVPVTTGTTQGTVPLNYFSYLGGSGNDVGLAIVSDPGSSSTSVRVAGLTVNSGWSAPITNNIGPGGGTDAFMARVVTTTTTTTTTTTANTSTVTFLGGSGTDIATSLAEDLSLNTYVVGETSGTPPGNFPTLAQQGSALQTSLAGTSDAFVSKLGPNVALLGFSCNASAPVSGLGCPSPKPANPTVNPSPVGVGNTITFVYSIYNQGDPVTGAIFTDSMETGSTATITSVSASFSGGATGGSCPVAAGGMTAACNLGTINSSTTTTTTSGSTTATTTAIAGTITVQVSVPAPSSPQQLPVGNVGQLTVPGTNFTTQPASGSAIANDFAVTATPPSQTVTAGATADYHVTVVPTGPLPEAVTLSCTGLPANASCAFANASIPNLNDGSPRGMALDITTVVRVTTPASLFGGGPIYALWLPLGGLALLGGGISRRRGVLLGLFFAAVLTAVMLQPACSNSSNNLSSTSGTPAGTYNVTVNAVSGSATRSTVVQLVVQ